MYEISHFVGWRDREMNQDGEDKAATIGCLWLIALGVALVVLVFYLHARLRHV